MLHAMRVWLVFSVAACGSAPRTVSNTGPAEPAPCGFTDVAALDGAAWKAALDYNSKLERADQGRPVVKPATPPPGPPVAVGSCLLHPIDVHITRYVVRAGERDIAQITMEGTLLLVPGLEVGGFRVGTSSDLVLERHPPDRFRISCMGTALGNMCAFKPAGSEEEPKVSFVVDGELAGQLDGVAAYEFFRHKPLRGVQLYTRI